MTPQPFGGRRPARAGRNRARPRLGTAWRRFVYPLLLVVLGLAAYANSFGVPFLLDDKPHILWQPAIQPPLSLGRMLADERPVVLASLALNYALGGFGVFGYHLLNLAAHVLCAIVVYGFARFTLRLPALRERFGSRADELALAAAAIFLLHPVQTESVTYVIQRSEVLAAVGVLAALWIAAGAAQASDCRPHLPALAAAAAFALLSKESAVVLPALFALYDWCFLAGGRLRALARRWPIHLTLVLAVGAIEFGRWWLGTHQFGGIVLGAAAPSLEASPGGAGAGAETIGPWRYLRWQFGVWLYYLRLLAVPDRLCFDCGYLAPWPVRASVLGEAVWLPALALGGLAVAAWGARRRYPAVTFGLLGSGIALAPTSSIVPLTDVYVEHRLYLPLAFLALLAVTAAFGAAAAAVRRGWLGTRTAHRALALAAMMVAGALGWLTVARNAVYADPVRLLEDTVAKAPASIRALYNLGNEYARRGQSELAVERFRTLIRLHPDAANYHVNLGGQYLRLGRDAEAVEAYEQARARAPEWAVVHRNLAVAYARLGRLDDAVAAAERAVALEPSNLRGRRLLADAYARAGRPEEARRQLRLLESIAEEPGAAPPPDGDSN